jgi:hypothetical protein
MLRKEILLLGYEVIRYLIPKDPSKIGNQVKD